MAAKLKKKNQLTKKNEEKMKKLMFIFNLIISALLAGVSYIFTIGSLLLAQFQAYHIALIAMCVLATMLVSVSVRELVNELKK